ncbi:glycoside hydrolase family 16 protein [Macroventuria anomochaeta]|uniref:Glycoside hydrolase family 16 protein n=1 Tax=Macroventuria anomochaeta TaxID=301207 RepID=A0ACB6RQS3_9PLEO|nr:glycoside hydrolase family 16 protein [Macroventuria anomochaeta]KAF2624320.1 glycoside hydrolase family 16 protein [Macroventuria anomochaeta]
MFFFTFLAWFLLYALPTASEVVGGDGNCTCGFYDSSTGLLFTDSIIVYFNETNGLPSEFVAEQYSNKYEKDWNAIYRQGADPANLQPGNDSLQFLVQPPTNDHIVQGAGLRTARQDIQHGSFRTLIKSPGRTSAGSAMSMMWQYNETEVTELSVMNMNDASEAWIGTFIGGEFTTRDLGVNYTQLLEQPTADRNYTTLEGRLSNGNVNPWDFTEYRIDWTQDHTNFYVGGNLTRQILHKDNSGMPSVPAPLYLKHWSTGNRFSMKGPPSRVSVAEVGWTRMFFNSSTMDDIAREDFVTRCSIANACLMDDNTLRGSTAFADEAMQKWRQDPHKSIKRMPALWISIGCLALSTILLLHTFIRRMTQPKTSGHGAASVSPLSSAAVQDVKTTSPKAIEPRSEKLMQKSPASSRPTSSKYESDDLTIEPIGPSTGTSIVGGATPHGPSRANSVRFDSRATTPHVESNFSSPSRDGFSPAMVKGHKGYLNNIGSEQTIAVPHSSQQTTDKIQMEIVTESAMPAPRMRAQPPPPRERIDHLAGLVALCAIVVTVMHFGLTFVPAIVIPGAPQHAVSEYWAQRIVAPFILNQMWLGVFFTTSVRFLTASYLRKGKLEDVAKAAVRRTPRLMIPVATIALLEYFLIDVGATKFLRYIPSLTWSTWPYVTRYENFGQYISEILELIYLVPNAVPQITFNYCTGVLWTIAVQLQGSWLVLLGAIVVREMKTTWKRIAFYIFCMLNHWYARSWGTYLWLGLLLTDLDVTYKYKKWLYAHPGTYYPLLTFAWLCVALGFAVNLLPNWMEFNFATAEHDIHPDEATGEALLYTDNAGYPAYYTPRLNGLLFAGGMQAIVELSTCVQWLLSTPPLLVLFPHIFTIYLLHGLVFWSWGSWLMVFLAERDFSYGINVAIVGVTSYAVLFFSLPIVTPVVEALGKDITALVWMTAQEKSPPRRRTLFPFPDDLFQGREVNGDVKDDVEANSSNRSSGVVRNSVSIFSGKGDEKEVVYEISPVMSEGGWMEESGKEAART